MNGLEEIQGYIKNFVYEKQQIQRQIIEIEEQRMKLAQQRNEKKKHNSDYDMINVLGNQISELGNKSQELQNQLDFNKCAIKEQMKSFIDNSVAEGIRKIRKIDEEITELEGKNEKQKERAAKYQLQKQEFYLRFGRMPELSERAEKAIKLQEKEVEKNELELIVLKEQIVKIQDDITLLAKAKRDLKNGNWNSIIEVEEEQKELFIEELRIEEIEPIEEISVEEFVPMEEFYVEEFKPVEEVVIEEFKEVEEIKTETNQFLEENSIKEIEELAKAIVEQIALEQTNYNNINEIKEESESEIIIAENVEDIITFEKEEQTKERIIIPLFGQKATISNIIIKFEEGNLVYKAQMSDGEDVKLYPANLGVESVLLRDKQNREECKEILINYAISEHKVLDKKIINKIDPLVCELLIECAERYGHNAQELIYNYALSFTDGDLELVPEIVYNLSYIEQSNLTKKERAILNKICKYARKNDKIDIIESFTGFRKIKYIFKRVFAINNAKVLPEAKY